MNKVALRTALLLCAWMISTLCCAAGTNDSQLSDLLKSNAPCRVRLQPEWIGHAHYVVRTGYFKNAPSKSSEDLETNLLFNLFIKSGKPDQFNMGPVIICDFIGYDAQRQIHTFRSSLPLDSEIVAATNLALLEKLFGKSQVPTDGWGSPGEMHSTAGWSFFTMKTPQSLETVRIFCMLTQRRGRKEFVVDSLEIMRGVATPAKPTKRATR